VRLFALRDHRTLSAADRDTSTAEASAHDISRPVRTHTDGVLFRCSALEFA
jgi:hypothetical protein